MSYYLSIDIRKIAIYYRFLVDDQPIKGLRLWHVHMWCLLDLFEPITLKLVVLWAELEDEARFLSTIFIMLDHSAACLFTYFVLFHSGSGAGNSLKEAGIFWSLLMILSFLFQAADTVLKVRTSQWLIQHFTSSNCTVVCDQELSDYLQEVIFLDASWKLKVLTVVYSI